MLTDRAEAGARLAERLEASRDERPVVLALPRGGVPVAAPIARRLNAPLDVLVARKVGAPNDPEYGLGAVVEDGTVLWDERRVRSAGYAPGDLAVAIDRELRTARASAGRFRNGRPLPDLSDRTVILVDDGIATGVTVRASLRSIHARRPRAVVVAAGVAPPDTVRALERDATRVVVLEQPRQFSAVGEFYRHFDPVTDDAVVDILARARAAGPC